MLLDGNCNDTSPTQVARWRARIGRPHVAIPWRRNVYHDWPAVMQKMWIGTWFVADQEGEGSFFPQIGRNSSEAGAKAVYWRCILTFYATSLAQNPLYPHFFFTNTTLPVVDGVDVARTFLRWGIEVINIPITYRAPASGHNLWGNQFYIFDIIDCLAKKPEILSALILDSDVVWTSSADPIAARVEAEGLCSYAHDAGAYPSGAMINGVTREQLAQFARRHGGPVRESIVYCGGEIFCATAERIANISEQVRPLWDAIINNEENAPVEEAHLLSVIYLISGDPIGNANDLIKRMWTTFHHRTVDARDLSLPLWHLPAEKNSGFPDLLNKLRRAGLETIQPSELGITREMLASTFGVPSRSMKKLIRDACAKVFERTLYFFENYRSGKSS